MSEVFSYSQKIFRDIYGLRNILAHEIWMSCDDYAFKTLFSKIEEEERKLKIAGRIKFDRDSKSIDAYNAIVRYIGKIKVIGVDDLKRAIEDINLCEWMLMTVNQVLGEDDPQKRDDLRRSFLVFGGTSHLFSESQKGLTKVEVLTSKKSSIFR
ncbi:hypothetical protein DL1_18535 [Thioclava dalianensis]|uniref:Uncharacterized protein n=1 Tax=Thioclava dalianensis TaxID=1185766 RepID=A0A074T823_9RHOB|nr:hypothetical protein DL1_18535 [Thioclava dalianensis]